MLRKLKGLTMAQARELTGVNVPAMEAGRSRPTTKQMLRLMECYAPEDTPYEGLVNAVKQLWGLYVKGELETLARDDLSPHGKKDNAWRKFELNPRM